MNSERIPLTIATWDKTRGTITLIFQEVGFSTIELGKLQAGDRNREFGRALGEPK